MGTVLPGSCALRSCRFAQLVVTWLLFPPNNEQGVILLCIRRRSGSVEDQFCKFFVLFFFVVSICSFLISLLFIRFNVVVVNGHDDIDSSTTSYTTRVTRSSDCNSKRLSYRISIEREETSDSDQVDKAAVKPK